MDEQFLYPITASLVAALVTTIGIAVVQRHESWGRQNSSYFAAFAAGVLITVSFLHLTPKSFDLLLSYKGDVDLETKLEEWERFYNFGRPHGAFDGKTPYEALRDKL